MSWRGVQGPQCSPKHNAFDSSGFPCLGDPPLPFLPRQSKYKPWKHRLRERTNRRLHRQPSKKHSKPMFRARHEFVTCSRTHQRMVTDGLERVTDGVENWVSPKKSPKKPINRMCPCEESTDEPTQSGISTTGRGRRRWGIRQPPRQGVNVKSTWPDSEVKLGTCHCLQYHSHMFHTRIPGLSSPTTEGILCGGDPPRGLSDETTSLGSWVQRWKGSQLQPFKPSHLDDFCSANNCLPEGGQGVAEQGELQGSERSKLSNSISNRSQGIVFHRRPLFQVALLPDPSGHTSGCLE